MWSGASVPTGWALCNGGNGTPNLLDRFIIGAGGALGIGTTGGSANATLVSHTHTASTNDAGSHYHRLKDGEGGDTTNSILGSGSSPTPNLAGQEDGTVFIDSDQLMDYGGIHSHTVGIGTTGFSGINANLPPYYALAFIMRVS